LEAWRNVMSTRKSKSGRQNCELVANEAARYRAHARTAQIAPNFPRGVARPALRALLSAGITHLQQLSHMREADLAELHGMGPKALEVLRNALQSAGLRFKRDERRPGSLVRSHER
jgi:hypothetical protein